MAFLWEFRAPHVQAANRYAKRGDVGDETGEHFGAHSGAELFPNGANYGAVRLPWRNSESGIVRFAHCRFQAYSRPFASLPSFIQLLRLFEIGLGEVPDSIAFRWNHSKQRRITFTKREVLAHEM